jgi:hypothetical protein
LGSPGPQSPAEPGDLGDWAAGEAVEDLLCDLAAGRRDGVVDRAELLVALPGQVDLCPRVASVEAVADLGMLLVGQVFYSVAQQAADLVERVVFVAASAEGVLLDAAADLIDDLGAEPHHMEGVQDCDRVG